MAYCGAVSGQQQAPEKVKAYCMEKFESKRPAYLPEAEQSADERGVYRKKRTVNSNGNLSRAQYIRFQEKGISDEHILAKYQDLTPKRLKMAKKRWELPKKDSQA